MRLFKLLFSIILILIVGIIFSINDNHYKLAILSCDQLTTQMAKSECKENKMRSRNDASWLSYLSGKNSHNQLNEKEGILLNYKTEKAYWTGEAAQAEHLSNVSIKNNLKLSRSYLTRALSQIHLGLSQKALDSLDLALSNDPNLYQAYYYKGLTLAEIHEYKKAMFMYEKAINIYPDFAMAHQNLARLQKDYQDEERAALSYFKAYNIWDEKIKKGRLTLENEPQIKDAYFEARNYLKAKNYIDETDEVKEGEVAAIEEK